MICDPCDDWHKSFTYSIGKFLRHAIGHGEGQK